MLSNDLSTQISTWWSTVQISKPLQSPRIRRDCCLPSRDVPLRITDCVCVYVYMYVGI